MLAAGLAIMTSALAELDVARINPVGGALRLGVLYDLLGRIRHEDVRDRTIRALSERSSQVANHLRALGVKRGDRVLLMLGNELALWEAMLALTKLGAVMIPATARLTTAVGR